jgi:hypothetical protein
VRRGGALCLALLSAACATAPETAEVDWDARPKALFIGKVQSSEFIVPLFEVMPAESDGTNDRIWHGEIYEVKLKVLDRLSGGPVGSNITVRLTAHARDFEGMTLAVLSSPDLAFYDVDIGASWWEDLSPDDRKLCVPDDLLDDAAFATFLARAKPVGDSHCMDIK